MPLKGFVEDVVENVAWRKRKDDGEGKWPWSREHYDSSGDASS